MLSLLCSVVILLGTPQQTQTIQQRTPPRDAAAPVQKGTAVIKGRVLSADGRPIRRARVTASAAGLTEARAVSTNTQGVFEIRELPAGRYSVTASRSGYLRVSYGQRRPGEGGRPLQIADGQIVERIELTLPRMGVVSGRVTDEIGDPLAGATVFAMQPRYFRGQRRLVPLSQGVTTDDTGQYRLLAIEPGDYVVMAFSRETWPIENDPTQSMGFMPTYFASTAVSSEAQRVRVDFGQELSNVDVAMVPGRVATVSGTATSSSGVPLAGEPVMIAQEFSGPNFTSSFGMPGGKVNADGTFVIKNVAPGDYRLSVRAPVEKDRPVEVASVSVNVAGANVDGLALVTGAAGSISGRIVADSGALPSFGSSRPRVMSQPLDRDFGLQTPPDNGRVRDDGTFDVMAPIGPQRLFVSGLPSGWALKAIDHDGRDYMDVLLELRPGQKLDGVAIVISDALPTVKGYVTDDTGQPAESTVLLFPQDESRWGEGASTVKVARPDQSGSFEMRHVAPGDYLVIALEYVRDYEWHDPEFLRNLRNRATKLTLAERQIQPVALTVRK